MNWEAEQKKKTVEHKTEQYLTVKQFNKKWLKERTDNTRARDWTRQWGDWSEEGES